MTDLEKARAEIARLEAALLESPAMAALLRASPGAPRFRCEEYDRMRETIAHDAEQIIEWKRAHAELCAEVLALKSELSDVRVRMFEAERQRDAHFAEIERAGTIIEDAKLRYERLLALLPAVVRKLGYLARDYTGDKETRRLIAECEELWLAAGAHTPRQ